MRTLLYVTLAAVNSWASMRYWPRIASSHLSAISRTQTRNSWTCATAT